MKKELIILLVVFLVGSLGMHHKEFFSYPIEHIMHLPKAGAFGFGALHPLIFTIIIYLLLWIPRGIGRLFKKKS
ncbi:hypothetical protein [Arcobacter sp. FWKO B]|uniref:hypothetical protein n=1 Tax=Arcobacter sp. FWKO B TaxID=2593672 RepID=UPI0018A69D37|nr:hypothetical protein [Arcobacter sp. FWKO B]QOG12301.1 hypothetical protein FWKOB_06145 [Arcobacter sp. FWKO B]